MQEKDSVWTGTLLLPLGNNREAGFTSVGTLATCIPYSGQRIKETSHINMVVSGLCFLQDIAPEVLSLAKVIDFVQGPTVSPSHGKNMSTRTPLSQLLAYLHFSQMGAVVQLRGKTLVIVARSGAPTGLLLPRMKLHTIDTVRGSLNKKRKAMAGAHQSILMTSRNNPTSSNQGTEQLKGRKIDSTFDPN